MGRALDNAMLNVGMKDVAKGELNTCTEDARMTTNSFKMAWPISDSAWKTSLSKNVTLRWVMVVLVALPPASSIHSPH
jgi:hypothetical protein